MKASGWGRGESARMATGREPERPRWLLAVSCWAGLMVLYATLAGSLDGVELAVGAVAAALATVAVWVSGSREHLGRMRWGWWVQVLKRVPGRVVVDSVRVLGAAVGPGRPGGRLLEVPFERGGDDTEGGSRRALVVAASSIAPNSYVVTVEALVEREPEERGLLVHQLVPTREVPGQGDRRWPI